MTDRSDVPVLRREVELPPPAHQRARLYLGFASLLLSFLIFLDAAICSHPAALETRATARRTAARLTRFRCPAAAVRPVRAAPATDPQLEEFRRQATEQLEHPAAILDDSVAGRFDVHQGGSPPGHGD